MLYIYNLLNLYSKSIFTLNNIFIYKKIET